MESLRCPNYQLCSGCSQWEIPYQQQLDSKKQHFVENLRLHQIAFPDEVVVHSIQSKQVRDRLDFVIENGQTGLYSKSKNHTLDLSECWQLSPALQNFLTEFRKIQWPIKKGSFRLRVSPYGDRGAWLDFSNLDIKYLLDEKKCLQALSELCWVEIGQRRKALINGKLAREAVLKHWTRTFAQTSEIPLLSTVGSFSQVGDQANKVITGIIEGFADQSKAERFLEYGAGTGNLTFPVLGQTRTAEIIETDLLALQGLQATAEKQGVRSRVNIRPFSKSIHFSQIDLLLVNPPRSGAPELFASLQASTEKPSHIIYMSCYPESYFRDVQGLSAEGYQLKEVRLVDQFPQTDHYEILSLWTR